MSKEKDRQSKEDAYKGKTLFFMCYDLTSLGSKKYELNEAR